MVPTTESASLRLGPLEEFLSVVHDRFGASGTGTVVLRLRGRLDVEQLAAALRAVQMRHPRLRGAIRSASRRDVRLHVADLDRAAPIPIRHAVLTDAVHGWKA